MVKYVWNELSYNLDNSETESNPRTQCLLSTLWIYRENWFSFIWNTTKLKYYEYQYHHQKASGHCYWCFERYGHGHHTSIAGARLSRSRQLAQYQQIKRFETLVRSHSRGRRHRQNRLRYKSGRCRHQTL